ncbi:MAG TPA: IclR family transcriptional regulator [Burkholderiales bacterium]|nr:IclR family transcriptional regulator [Burkholderiales bacterium]
MAHEEGSPRSLTRVLGLFGAIARTADGMTLARLSSELDSPKSSLLTLLRPLVAQGYLTHEGGVYRLGPAIFRLATDILSTRSFPKLIRPFMQQLVERSQESVYLAVIDRSARCVTYVEGIESPQPVRYMAPLGAPRPLYCSAAGRLLLAYSDDAWRESYVKSVQMKAMTERTLTNRAALRRELEKIRGTGLAISIGEAVPGAAGLAAPVFDTGGKAVAALLIGAPVDRFERELPALRKLMKDVAQQASGLFTGAA